MAYEMSSVAAQDPRLMVNAATKPPLAPTAPAPAPTAPPTTSAQMASVAAPQPASAQMASVSAPAPTGGALPQGATDMGNNLVRLANGQVVDRNHPLYQQALAQAPGGAPTGTSAAPGGAPTTISGVLNQAPQAGPPTTVTGAFQQALMSRLAPQSPISTQSAEIAPAIAANRTAEARQFARDREMLAERRAAQGLGSSGSFDQGLGQLAGDRAAREGRFEGQQVADLARQRSQEILQTLAMAGGLLSDQDKMGLQRELANLDATLRREGLSVQQQLGQGDLSLRDKLGSGQLNLGLLGTLLQNEQFGQNLGANLGMFNANLNQNALLNLLGGL